MPIDMKKSDTNFKQFFKEFFELVLNEDEDSDGIPEKDKPKIVALKKRTAYDKVKEKGELKQSLENNLKSKEDAVKNALKDKTVEDHDEAVKNAKDELEHAKVKVDTAKQTTNAAKIELNAIK